MENLQRERCQDEAGGLQSQAVQTKKAPPQDIAASVLLVVAGCVVAGIGDFSFDLKGCAMGRCVVMPDCC